MSPGYWRDLERTQAASLPDPRPARSGDRLCKISELARVGEDDLVYFMGHGDLQI